MIEHTNVFNSKSFPSIIKFLDFRTCKANFVLLILSLQILSLLKLDQVQNIGLSTIRGATKSSLIAIMRKTAGVEHLDSRMNTKLLTHGEKINRMIDHPLHKRLQYLTKNRLKRTSLNNVLKEQQRKQSDILAHRPEECEVRQVKRQ